MARYVILLLMLWAVPAALFAQGTTGKLEGRVADKATGEPIMYGNVAVYKGEELVTGTTTDFDGYYSIPNLNVGSYNVEFRYVGYQTTLIEGVEINANTTREVNAEMSEGNEITEVVVTWDRPLIEVDNTSSQQTLTSEEIGRMSTRNIGTLQASAAGVNQTDEGRELNANGGRSSANDVYVDGVRVVGGIDLPETEIDQITIITSGVPAKYGDATGAITNITTKGPSQKFSGGVAIETSQFLDNFGANRVDLSVAGPILKRPARNDKGEILTKNDGKDTLMTSMIGYRLAVTGFTTADGSPSALGSYQVKEDRLREIQDNPLLLSPTGALVPAADFLTSDDFEERPTRPNARSSFMLANGKLDFRLSNDMNIALGGQYRYSNGRSAAVFDRMFNYELNPIATSGAGRGYIRFRHDVSSTVVEAKEGEEIDKSDVRVLRNLSYEIQADYSRENSFLEDPRYGNRFFEYGYVGRFGVERQPVLTPEEVSLGEATIVTPNGDTIIQEVTDTRFQHTAFQNVFTGYTPDNNINDGLNNFNNNVDFSNISTLNEIPLVNGRTNLNIDDYYGLYSQPFIAALGGNASNIGDYRRSQVEQYRATASTSFELASKKQGGLTHSLEMGLVFEQRVFRSYSLSPFSIWNLAEQQVNSHISNAADQTNPTGELIAGPDGRLYPVYGAEIRVDEETGEEVAMSTFGSRLRENLGIDKSEWINIHGLTPDQLDLAMFEPTTLIEGRQRIMGYYGYDYEGNIAFGNSSFLDFFNATADGVNTRPVAPFQPIYTAGYIEDKFKYKDMIVRFGVRADRYDANTLVPKDPYSLVGYYTAGDFVNGTPGTEQYGIASDFSEQLPSNIGDDFAVYMSGEGPDASIAGFRQGDQWFNSSGTPVDNPNTLGALIQPALVGVDDRTQTSIQGINYDPELVFEQYQPQIVVMPRLAFSFTIDKDANFFANYDVLAQRPDLGAALATPLTYYNFEFDAEGNGVVNNPNLQSQKTVNYEVGYQQALGPKDARTSMVRASLLYREQRDLIQLVQYVQAYPIDRYRSFGNKDFSTVKSFKLQYEFRPRVESNLRILANYTLQFAEGTGSSPTSGAGIAAEDLNYIFPLDFDQRHTIFLNADYRYESGRKYNGPKIGNTEILKNTGFNLTANIASGTPYTRRLLPGAIGEPIPARFTQGSINGARLPWNVRFGARIDREFMIGKDEEKKRPLRVYVRVQNILNTQNVLNVYSATGSPVDDGFLTIQNSPGIQLAEVRPEAYTLLYRFRMANPANISLPRRIFFGASLQF